MKHDLHLGCDTLYFGLVVDDFTFKSIFEEIKNYLSFPLTVNLTRSRSKWYECEAINEDEGFYLFFSPHRNLHNDYATIQLTGKFFRDFNHEKALKELIKTYACFIRLQRIDVCLDVLWKELPIEVDDLTLSLGFPVPQYSANWKNVRLPFETYGRWSTGVIFTNMISCGKSDLRLRVYDKSLDLLEKYKMSYSEYYGYEEDFLKVYRIEYQMRGKSLKEFLYNAQEMNIDINDLDKLCACVLSSLFWKFDFLYIDEIVNPVYVSTSAKRSSTLDGQIVYHHQKASFHYYQWLKKVDEKNQVMQANKEIAKNIKKFARDESEKISSVFSLNQQDFENAVFDNLIQDLLFTTN